MLRGLLDIDSIVTGQHHVCLSSMRLPTSGQRAGWLQVTRQGREIAAVHRQAVHVRGLLPVTGRCHKQPNKIL